ncbi:MAG: hypothetical protein QXU74_02465 [Candidatus Aenigmatarchaeota archaeon]
MSIWDWEDKKMKKRRILALNKMRGETAETLFRGKALLSGYEVTRTGKGSDYKIQKIQPTIYGIKKVGRPKLIEVKSSKTAKASKLQKKMIKKRKVKIWRPEF